VFLPDLTDPQAAERIAAKITETLAVPIPFEGREMPVSVSVGVCAAVADEFDADAFMRNADAALYFAPTRAKGKRRGNEKSRRPDGAVAEIRAVRQHSPAMRLINISSHLQNSNRSASSVRVCKRQRCLQIISALRSTIKFRCVFSNRPPNVPLTPYPGRLCK
jgi:hypothetical protein